MPAEPDHDPNLTEDRATLQNGGCTVIEGTDWDPQTQPESILQEAAHPTETTETTHPPITQNDGQAEPEISGPWEEPMRATTPAATNPPDQEDRNAAANPAPAPAEATPNEQPMGDPAPTDPHLMQADRLLEAIYGDHICADAGTEIDGGNPADRMWQLHWQRMTQLSPSHYAVLKGMVGR